MTQEEKAKAYDEALEKAKEALKTDIHESGIWAIQRIFPQLRESEDEKIMEALIDFFDSALGKDLLQRKCGLNPDAVLAYLEKQKEAGIQWLKSDNVKNPDKPYIDKAGMFYTTDGRMCYTSEIEKQKEYLRDFIDNFPYSDEQKEQIPYTDFVIEPHKGDDNNPYDMGVPEAHEYAIKRGFDTPFNYGEVYVDERHLTQTIGNILRWADEHPKEQKPEWSDEDEEMKLVVLRVVKGLYNWTRYMGDDDCEIAKKAVDWVTNLSQRPQPEYETYKSAKHNLAIKFMNYLDENRPESKMSLSNAECEDIDKAFEEDDWEKIMRYANKYAWKPSEEQLVTLLRAEGVIRIYGTKELATDLAQLYEQLKKL